MYNIDNNLSALLQMLQKSRHSGRIHTQIPYGFGGLSGGYVFIDMVLGRAIACHLVNTQKQIILAGTEAMDVTSTMGNLHWTVGQEYQQTNTSLPAVRPNTSGAQYTNPNQPAIRPYPTGTQRNNPHASGSQSYPTQTQHTNPRLPAIQPYSPDTQHTNSRLPAIQPYSPSPQHNSPGIPPNRSNASDTQHTNTRFPALRPSIPANINGQPYYSFSTFVPERLIDINANLLTGLNRRLRRVLVLVDSQRSVLKIAAVLHPHEDGQQEVFDSLKQLAKMQIISIRKV